MTPVDQLRILESNAERVFSDLHRRQDAMEEHVQGVLSQVSAFPCLAPEVAAAEMAEKALQQVKDAQGMLQELQTQKTLEMQHKRQVLGGVNEELRILKEISRTMPHKTQYYQDKIVQLGEMAVMSLQ